MEKDRPEIPYEIIKNFCRRHHIIRLTIFGSYLRGDFGPHSDIDFLVEFDREHIPMLLDIAGVELELSGLLNGKKVDLRTPRVI